jgi:DUF3043 family protein
VFSRNKTADPVDSSPSPVVKESGKGRPTPSRREAQAAARARAKGPTDKKERSRLDRRQRAEANAKVREAMRTGDERSLPQRDKGPVRRFVRDYVDARLCIAELMLPVLVVTILVQSLNASLSSGILSATVLLVALDTALLVFRLRRELRRRFSGENTRGAVSYAVLRSTQFRKLRMPKPQVKLGTKLPERY